MAHELKMPINLDFIRFFGFFDFCQSVLNCTKMIQNVCSKHGFFDSYVHFMNAKFVDF